MKAVIFDMDGVLIDSENLWKRAENVVFSSLGVELDKESCELTKTMTTDEVTRYWYNRNPWKDRTLKEVEQLVISEVIDLIEKEDCEIFGITDFITKVKSLGFKIGLATNSPQRVIDSVLIRTKTSQLFDSVLSAEMEERGKPAPDIYISASRNLGVAPEYCIVIEDSNNGALAAKRAGMKVIAFSNNNRNEFVKYADLKIDRFEPESVGILNCLELPV